MLRETRNKSAEAGITSDIGRVYIKKKKYDEANGYLQESLKLSRKLGLKRVSRHVYYALVDLRLQQGKSTEAFNYMRAYYDVRDSLLNGSKTRQIVELETRFEKEKQATTNPAAGTRKNHSKALDKCTYRRFSSAGDRAHHHLPAT